jgi:hypothetical protein
MTFRIYPPFAGLTLKPENPMKPVSRLFHMDRPVLLLEASLLKGSFD